MAFIQIAITVNVVLACSWPSSPISPLVSFCQHNIHKNSTNHIRARWPGDNSITQQVVICKNCDNWISLSEIQPPSQWPNFDHS